MQPIWEFARAHAPLLMVAAPFAAAALMFALPAARIGWLIAAAAALASAALGVGALSGLLSGAVLSGGAMLLPDGIGLTGAALVACAGALTLLAAGGVLDDFHKPAQRYGLALCLLVCSAWIAALLARDLVGVLVAGETAWLAAAGLVALGGERERGGLNGALRMLTVGGASAALGLTGAALLGAAARSFDLAALPLAQIDAPTSAALGVVLMLVALAMKAGMAPFHSWLGAAQGRAAPLAGLTLAWLGSIGALAVMIRLAVFTLPAPALGVSVSGVIAAIAAASVIVGSLQAMGATNLYRLLAYAGVAQAGAAMLGVAIGSPAGIAAALVQLMALSGASAALFGGVVASGCGRELAALDGLGRRAPFSAAAITIGALSLIGAPLTLGFLGRWRVIEAALGFDWWWAAVLVIGASLAGVVYAGRMIERLYFRRAATVVPIQRSPWRAAFAPALAASVGAIAMGAEPSVILRLADAAARQIAGLAP